MASGPVYILLMFSHRPAETHFLSLSWVESPGFCSFCAYVLFEMQWGKIKRGIRYCHTLYKSEYSMIQSTGRNRSTI